ncbi:ABC transporter ATP-binding protein [Chelativorans salis]|uniref:ABC transporter ATP-binding protein n=1 Tax=Chelativorans salis TaxID=2978478 RepID=A0ABT2LT58_9HYPH|nr:ABC transporter ATP-binding protein [Chelativorans sp. EGI FJ00035]MCT7377725.1 ABC transporter ATP-binding protein [Chelativorans sp. EGI FJ00035]
MNQRPDHMMLTARDDGIAKGDVLLEARNISLAFGGVKALTEISLNILKGEIRAIIGPNGAGKTSMLNVINGFYTPQQGSIVFRGRERRAMKPHHAVGQGIARTFQNVALFKGMSTLDNIMAGRSVMMKRHIGWQMLWHGPALKEEIAHREKVEEIIDFLEIQHIRHTPVGKLPYGLQKRVELGRALAMEPSLLLLDEPMAGMNLEEKEDMSRFIIDVNQQRGTTIALIEHDMGVVMDLSDRVAVLDYGKKIADGTPDAVKNDQGVIDAYLGVPR